MQHYSSPKASVLPRGRSEPETVSVEPRSCPCPSFPAASAPRRSRWLDLLEGTASATTVPTGKTSPNRLTALRDRSSGFEGLEHYLPLLATETREAPRSARRSPWW